jgi:hypothetical protein
VLLPNGIWGDANQLNRFSRSEEVRVLREAQVGAKSERALGIAFLLAALGEDYRANRIKLLEALKGCGHKPDFVDADCVDFVVGYLMELCRRGDNSLFHPIFNASANSDGAFSQALGSFYSDMLQKKPNHFLAAISRYPKTKQDSFCWNAGVEDGGGMNEETFRQVRLLLKGIAARPGSPLSPIARNCLLQLQAGYDQAIKNGNTVGG